MIRDGAVAAVDCGTNSTRLLINDAAGRTLRREMVITRLGEGVDNTGRLGEAGVARTIEVLKQYRKLMDAAGVCRCRVVATSAARDAANSELFFEAVESVMGVAPELLSGEEEGRLSFAGACADLSGVRADLSLVAVVDIGGGSTEISIGAPGALSAPMSVSLDIGCVRITERFLESDPPTPDQLAQARAHVAETVARGIDTLAERRGSGGPGAAPTLMIGLAGTVSCAARLMQGMDVYSREAIHHSWIERAQAQIWCDRLASEDRALRSAHPGMEPGRVDVIVGGLVVLIAVMDALAVERFLVSEDDILDGLAASVANSDPAGS